MGFSTDDGSDHDAVNLDPHSSRDRKKSYIFPGKVVIGISVIIGLATLITFFSSLNSASIVVQPFGSPNKIIHPPTTKVDRNFVLVQNDFGWNGTSGGPTIIVNKGDNVQIVIINAGNMAHNFGIAKVAAKTESLLDSNRANEVSLSGRLKNLSYSQISAMPCPDCKPVYRQAQVDAFMPPLSQQVVAFKADQAGTFKYFCMVRGHIWLGMIGSLIVQNPSEQGGST